MTKPKYDKKEHRVIYHSLRILASAIGDFDYIDNMILEDKHEIKNVIKEVAFRLFVRNFDITLHKDNHTTEAYKIIYQYSLNMLTDNKS